MISIVILNFNGKKFLDECLSLVLRSNYPNFEVIFVDNASTDGSVEFIQSNFREHSNLRIIRNNRNLGFAEGNNVGAKVAKGKYVVFLNVDTKVDPNWLKELVTVMESDKSIGATQSKILLFDGRTIDSAGDFINFYGFGCLRGHGEIDRGQFNRMDEIFSARGAAMAVRKKVLEEVGYFDPAFFMTCEDLDLSWRIRLCGYKIMFVPTSTVYHFGSGVRKNFQTSAQSYYYNTRNVVVMLIKNYGLKNLLLSLTGYLTIEIILFLISIPFPSKKAYNLSRLKAILWSILNFRSIWRERLRVQHYIRKISDDQIKKLMIKGNPPFLTIVWNTFYKNFIDHNHFINQKIYSKNKWLS
jgi:GT2 family glycosyltransferase